MNDEFNKPQRKLTDWKKEPTVGMLEEELRLSKGATETQLIKIRSWKDQLDVAGNAKPKEVKGRSSVQPKLIRRQAEWRYSALTEPFLGSNKMYSTKPVTFEDVEGAKQNELVLNWQFRTKINKIKFIDEYVRTTVDEGTSIIKLSWIRETRKVKEQQPIYSFYPVLDAMQAQQVVQQLDTALQLREENIRGFNELPEELKEAAIMYEQQGVPVVAVVEDYEEIEVEKVIQNRPALQILNPENVFIDPSCEGDFDKAKFVIVSFESSKAELKQDGRYTNLNDVNWGNTSLYSDPNHTSQTPDNFNFEDTARRRVIVYEYWGYYDINGKDELEPIVASWIGDTMIRMERNPFPDEKPPFVLVPYMPVKRSIYGEADAALLEDNQRILGAVTRGMIDLLGRSANSQQGFSKGMLDAVNQRKFEEGRDYFFNPNVDPRMGHIVHTYPEIPNSALTMLQLQNQEAEALTGVKAFSGGMSGNAYGDVAAGIRGMLDAASKREMAILRRLAKGIVEIGSKIISMNQVFLTEEEVIRVTNEEYVSISREDLKGSFDLEVDISTAEVDNAQSQDLAFMLQTMGPNMDFNISKIILSKIATLKRMPDLAKQIERFEPQPDPITEQIKQLEVAKLQAEVEEIQSKIALNNAKAKEASSNADMKDLEFVEQETGTKHARDMDKQQAQAQANQDLEVTKGLLNRNKEKTPDNDIKRAIGYNELTSPSIIERNNLANQDPRLNLGSKFYDPSMDPINPNLNI